VVQAVFRGRNRGYGCVAVVDAADEIVQVFTCLAPHVPLHRMSAAAELCVRADSGMKLGKFEIDLCA
jgi:hypothetical protein